ncbi:hypothetical protein Ahy_A03g013875 [Arachis hypogaea]|uniref:ATPase dynein-related AAA domain-containing protein n=1 Tax=Arachis hypogaea TaxID=3818 RepID=A0A445DWD0_ARAHY|nr:hypothetical protein Ahy_A03g013875 [Arachis hypogaea]
MLLFSSNLNSREGEDVLHLVPVEGVESPLYALEINPEKSMEEFRAASQKLGDGVDDMEFGWRIVLGSFTGFCRAAFGSVGGVGGGGIFVPMLSLIISFDPKSSTAISKCMIMGAALSTVYYNLRLRHPTLDMPIIDYDLALLIQPMLMLGINIGVTFNVLFPDWMVTILLIVIFVVTSTKAFFKGVETWKKETIMKKFYFLYPFFLIQVICSIFESQDGPLVKAMRGGDLFLVDEISLADNSVLERLNSVLEPERMLVS